MPLPRPRLRNQPRARHGILRRRHAMLLVSSPPRVISATASAAPKSRRPEMHSMRASSPASAPRRRRCRYASSERRFKRCYPGLRTSALAPATTGRARARAGGQPPARRLRLSTSTSGALRFIRTPPLARRHASLIDDTPREAASRHAHHDDEISRAAHFVPSRLIAQGFFLFFDFTPDFDTSHCQPAFLLYSLITPSAILSKLTLPLFITTLAILRLLSLYFSPWS